MPYFQLSFLGLIPSVLIGDMLLLNDFQPSSEIIMRSKQIFLPDCPDAYNPSLLQIDDKFLLIFRYTPNQAIDWISCIGAVWLDDQFDPVSKPQLLTTRCSYSRTESQSEDPRVFFYRGRIFIIFNDNINIVNPSVIERRDMYIVELFMLGERFSLSSSLKLVHQEKYNTQWWQKNWAPFEWNDKLFFIYSIRPHRIISPNLMDGQCYFSYETTADIRWNWGELRGSSPPLDLGDGEYLSFFHSAIGALSDVSLGVERWHYFMGAYTFSSEPPFQVTKIIPFPLIAPGFYTVSDSFKRVIFPGGCIMSDAHIYVTYGKDDREMWVATLDKKALLENLKPVNP